MTINDLTNPEYFVHRAQGLLASTGDDSYDDCKPRNDDLSCMAATVQFVAKTLPSVPAATAIKELFISAYLLGRRDATIVPSEFSELLK